MGYNKDAVNLINNLGVMWKRYLDEPSNVILDDVRAGMRQTTKIKQDELLRDISRIGTLNHTSFNGISNSVWAMDREFHFKCSSRYYEADQYIIRAFIAPTLGLAVGCLDAAIYALTKADKHPFGKILTKTTWRDQVSKLCEERFLANKSIICMNSVTIAGMKNQELWVPSVIEEWIKAWESQNASFIASSFM